jgi:methyl-accepting chemotaxis protein
MFLGTLAVYFTAVVGDYTSEKVIYLVIDVALTTIIVSTICTKMAWNMLSSIISDMENPKKSASKTKECILQFPFYFGIISGMKVPGVFIPVIIALMIQIDLTIINLMPLLLLIPMNIPIVFNISYLYTENSMEMLLRNERICDAQVDHAAYKKLMLNSRILLFAISVLMIPTTVFGYFIVLLNLKMIVFANIEFHLIFIITLSVLSIVVLLRFMTKNMKMSTAILVNSLDNITGGDFRIKGVPMLTSNEIGVVCQYVNALFLKLRDVITQIMKSSQVVSASSFNITEAAQSLSQSASEQSTSVEEITTSMEEMSSMIAQNTQNARKTDEIARLSANQAIEGGKAVAETVESMRQIRQMVNLIEDIASKTDLLALNAAIEAARAGEYGKGFAVVASEIRKLAERSQVSAKEIVAIIMKSVDVAEHAGSLLKEIVPNIKMTADLVQEITDASAQQNAGVEQINEGMEQVSSTSQQNASSSEELATTADSLSSYAIELRELMAYFKVNEDASAI